MKVMNIHVEPTTPPFDAYLWDPDSPDEALAWLTSLGATFEVAADNSLVVVSPGTGQVINPGQWMVQLGEGGPIIRYTTEALESNYRTVDEPTTDHPRKRGKR